MLTDTGTEVPFSTGPSVGSVSHDTEAGTGVADADPMVRVLTDVDVPEISGTSWAARLVPPARPRLVLFTARARNW